MKADKKNAGSSADPCRQDRYGSHTLIPSVELTDSCKIKVEGLSCGWWWSLLYAVLSDLCLVFGIKWKDQDCCVCPRTSRTIGSLQTSIEMRENTRLLHWSVKMEGEQEGKENHFLQMYLL